MSRILIGWELGAGRGHVQSMRMIGAALTARGHHVGFALQRLEAAAGVLPDGALFQAPVWPRLLAGDDGPPMQPSVTLIDILARVGMARPGCLTRMIRAWDAIVAGFRPDIVIGDYAPALIAAAHGRVPSAAVGPGFQVPPGDAAQPMRFSDNPPGYDEAAMLDLIDADLREAGRTPLDSLAALFRVDRPLVASFAELDPYGPRDVTYLPPAAGDWAPPADAPGDEIFVYANGPVERLDALWQGLSATGRPVRAHLPDAALARRVAALGVKVETRPIPWPTIARRTRIAVDHGAHGIMCGLLLAGIPQLCLPLDLEKRLHSAALERAGYGLSLAGGDLTADLIARTVEALYADDEIRARTRCAAPGFAARVRQPYGEAVADAVETLV